MDENDAPILRYVFRQARPRRHLEFGTWEGRSALACLEECEATVWSLNLREGETNAQGRWAYDAWLEDFAAGLGPSGEGGDTSSLMSRTARNGRTVVRTDALGAIGHLVYERGLGHRFCQILCDSREWDSRAYPDGFFDTVLVDGGHTAEVVTSDTLNALRLVRAGGLILWHDYCLDARAQASCPSISGVVAAIESLHPTIAALCSDWFWIEPSWLLVGVRRGVPYALPGAGR